MSARALVLIGGGEHARVVAEAAGLSGWDVLGCLDPVRTAALPWLGDDGSAVPDGASLIIAFAGRPGGDNRRQAVERWSARDARWATVIHPAATVSPSARIAAGAFIGARALVHTGASVEAHAIVNSGAVIEHDCLIGAGAHVAPGAVLGGAAAIGAWAFIGLGACIRDHRRIGAGTVVGMGAVVVNDVSAGQRVAGNPAQPLVMGDR